MTPSPRLIVKFVKRRLRRRPRSELQDIYKFLYQAFHGPAHSAVDPSSAFDRLREEWEGLSPDGLSSADPLTENARLEQTTPPLFILNLLPAKKRGLRLEFVAEEYLYAVQNFPLFFPDRHQNLHESFIQAWRCLGDLIACGQLLLPEGDYRVLTEQVETSGWPPLHHSERYRQSYDPHYRLVLRRPRVAKYTAAISPWD